MQRPRGVSHVLVLHDAAAEGVPPAARHVAHALAEGGLQTTAFGVSDDLDAVVDEVRRHRPEIVFNLVAHFAGNPRLRADVAAALELMGVPFTGAGPAGLHLAEDEEMAARVLAAHGVPVAAPGAAGVDTPVAAIGNDPVEVLPPPGAKAVEPALAEIVAAACGALRLRDYAVVVVRVEPGGRVVGVVRALANPSLGRDDDLARAAARAGLSYPDLMRRILAEAQGRRQAEAESETLPVA